MRTCLLVSILTGLLLMSVGHAQCQPPPRPDSDHSWSKKLRVLSSECSAMRSKWTSV